MLFLIFKVPSIINYQTPRDICELKSRILCGEESSALVWQERSYNGTSCIKFSFLGSNKISLISEDTAENASDPSGIWLSDSNLIIVWQGYRKDIGASINAALINYNSETVAPWRICNYDSTERYHPVVANFNALKYLVAWQDAKANNYDILAKLFTSSHAGINSTFRINSDTTQFSQYSPEIGKIGEFCCVLWEDRQLGYSAVWGQFLNQSGEKIGPNFLIAPELNVDQTGIAVASCNNKMAVVWQVAKPETMAIMLKYFTLRGADTAAQVTNRQFSLPIISNLIQVSDSNLALARADARCAFFHDGKLAVIWMDQRHSKMHIYGQLFDRDGNRLGRNFPIEMLPNVTKPSNSYRENGNLAAPSFSKEQFLPDIAVDAEGHLIICWTERDKDNVSLRLEVDTITWTDWIPAEYHSEIKKRFWLYSPSPSPFSKLLDIKFELPEPEKVKIKIFDVSGRLVLQIADDYFPAGIHNLTWNGRDVKGRAVSAGSYFIRMEVAGFIKNRKVVKIK